MQASFTPDGELLVPSPTAASPWSDEMLNGHHMGGLIGWGVQRDSPDPEFQLSRMTVDMVRAVPMVPLRVETRRGRDGRRLRAVDVSVLAGDLEVLRGSAVLLRRSEHPDSEPYAPTPWDVPSPEQIEGGPTGPMSWEIRRINPWGSAGPGRVWMRETAAFVEGEELTPLVRAALMADFTNPLSNSGPDGLAFINTDVTMYLARDPRGEWIGMESAGHLGHEGVAFGTTWMYDQDGLIGHCVAGTLPDPRIQARQRS
ncbi:thioesterase family protein [Blastococcus sp. TML/M2B]|uniref:acyl-CoA thioesterase domain-containing protein n=1 Tax=Blastococcus sp. TML/M2B TaxID=2798727 RepID=UPI00190DC781|nr:acyl-CoA thioesterase domain-containing protein [Blastococcus sp. TML/M2B]MBN1094185.1 thioesterase family protein [Blastococcus sp. TML/M2B]